MRTLPFEIHGDGRFVLERRRFVPAYLKTYEEGRLTEKVEEALSLLASCTICPRNCRVDRLGNVHGMCRVGRYARVSSFFPHFGEEDVLRGWKGSGTIFFAWCNLRCVFCQNFETSQIGEGEEVSPRELAGMMVQLQEMGCHNINFVTPEHVVPQILEAVPYAIEMGLRLPLVYNTSAYDSLDSIRLLEGVVDVYLPDFKLWDPEHCRRYLLARDYPVATRAVVKAMHQQVGELKVDHQGLTLRGVLVRHLVMPELLEDTRQIMRYLATEVSQNVYVNIMDQYYPTWRVTREEKYSAIRRRVWPEELRQAYDYAREVGLWRFDSRWRHHRFFEVGA